MDAWKSPLSRTLTTWAIGYTFQPLIHSKSFDPAGFIACLVDTTSIGSIVAKS